MLLHMQWSMNTLEEGQHASNVKVVHPQNFMLVISLKELANYNFKLENSGWWNEYLYKEWRFIVF